MKVARTDTEATARLKYLGDRRLERLAEEESMANEIKEAVATAQYFNVPMTEIARLLKIDRSTLYRTYVDAA